MKSKKNETITLKVSLGEKSFMIEIKVSAKYEDLCSEIEKIFKISLINYSLKMEKGFTINQKNFSLDNFSDGDLIKISNDSEIRGSKEIKESLKINENSNLKVNVNFFNDNPDDKEDFPKLNLTGILKLCLLKQIARNITDEQLEKINSEEIKEIINKLKKEISFSKKTSKDIKSLLSDQDGYNILEYAKYVNEVVEEKNIDNLLDILDESKKKEIEKFWETLSKYENYNEFFEKEIFKNLKESYFDYSVTSLAILNKQNRKKYEESRKKCPNCVKRILYHDTQIDSFQKF